MEGIAWYCSVVCESCVLTGVCIDLACYIATKIPRLTQSEPTPGQDRLDQTNEDSEIQSTLNLKGVIHCFFD